MSIRHWPKSLGFSRSLFFGKASTASPNRRYFAQRLSRRYFRRRRAVKKAKPLQNLDSKAENLPASGFLMASTLVFKVFVILGLSLFIGHSDGRDIDPGFVRRPWPAGPNCLAGDNSINCYGIDRDHPLESLLRQAKRFRNYNETINAINSAENITRIYLYGENYEVSTILQDFDEMEFLEIRGGDENSTVTIDPNTFRGVTKLKTLQVSNIKIQGDLNEILKPLRSGLEGAKFYKVPMKSSISAFTEFTNLRDFEVVQSDLIEFPAQPLRKSAPTMKKIGLSHNKITTIKADDLSAFTNLEFLTINYNPIRTIDANAFKNLTKLKQLWLNDLQVSNLSADMFRTNTQLYLLSLSGNPTTGLTREQFSFLPSGTLQLPN